jgi:chaperonin GroES
MTSGNVLPTKVLCKALVAKEEKTQSGIYIPTVAQKESTTTADVVLTGEGTTLNPMPVKVGDRILFSPHACQKITLDKTEYLLVDSRDILFYFVPDL